jgi:hypothetical protein
MPQNTRTRYLPHGITVEHPTIVTDAELAKILIAYGQQLLAAPPAAPPKTEPHHSKLPPPRGRRR